MRETRSHGTPPRRRHRPGDRPPRGAAGGREGSERGDRRSDLGGGEERGGDRQGGSRRRGDELVRRVRDGSHLRLADGCQERRQRHRRRRRDGAAQGAHDRRHVPLPRRRHERCRDEPGGRPHLHHARGPGGRDQPGDAARAHVRHTRRQRRPERPLDRLVDRVRDDDALRRAHRHAVGRLGDEPRRGVDPRRRAPCRRHLPLPPRRLQRPRDDAWLRPVVPHRPGAVRLDGRCRRDHGLLRARQRGRRPAGQGHGRLVRVRHDGRAGKPDRGDRRRLRDPRDQALRAAHRPPAGNALPLPRRREKRRRHDGRRDAGVHDQRRPARRHRAAPALRAVGRPDRERRPGRAVDELVVRARPDDVVRHDDRGQKRRGGPRRRRRVGARRRPGRRARSTTRGSSPGARPARRAARTSSSARPASRSSAAPPSRRSPSRARGSRWTSARAGSRRAPGSR